MTSNRSKVRRRVVVGVGMCGLGATLYSAWSPGVWHGPLATPGGNAAWLEHGWLGSDAWFSRRENKDARRYREAASIRALRATLIEHDIRDVYPHLAPTSVDGDLPPADRIVTERLARELHPVRVLPWIGGVVGKTAFPDDDAWRERFFASVASLLEKSPALAGVHVNLEPWLDTHASTLDVLRGLRRVVPEGKLLSVAAFPPETSFISGITWRRDYFARVTSIVDQVSVMLYNTSILLAKPYVRAVQEAAFRAIDWSVGASVILGVPTFDSEGSYHIERVENLETACAGITSSFTSHATTCPMRTDARLLCKRGTGSLPPTLNGRAPTLTFSPTAFDPATRLTRTHVDGEAVRLCRGAERVEFDRQRVSRDGTAPGRSAPPSPLTPG